MGIMSCYREGCEEIMCDTYIPYIGYLCRKCQTEFKEHLKVGEETELAEGVIIRELEKFMGIRKGFYTQEGTLTVEEFFNEYNK